MRRYVHDIIKLCTLNLTDERRCILYIIYTLLYVKNGLASITVSSILRLRYGCALNDKHVT